MAQAIESLDCQRKMIFGSSVYTLNGNMFAGVHQDDIFVRLSADDRAVVQTAHDEATPFEPMLGRAMREYVVLPETVYGQPDEFGEWLGRAHGIVLLLPVKQSCPHKQEPVGGRE